MNHLRRFGVFLALMGIVLILGTLPLSAQLSVSKTSIAFGSIAGLTSKTDSFYVKNSSGLGYALTGISNSSSRFVVVGNPTAFVFDSVKILVTFTPDTVATVIDTIYIRHNASGGLLKVALSGSGISPIITKSPRTGATLTTMTIADQWAGLSITDSISVKNISGVPTTVSAMSMRNPKFTILTPVPFTIKANDSQWVYISFLPPSAIKDLDTLFITHNSTFKGSSPTKLPIYGRGISHERFYTMSGVNRVRALDNFDTLRVNAATAGTPAGAYDPKVPVDSARAGVIGLVNAVDTVWVRVDSVTFTSRHFISTTPVPFTHRPGDQYDRNINFSYRPDDLSPVHRDTLVIWTNDPIPSGNRISLLVEGAPRRAVYFRSLTRQVTQTFGTVGLAAVVDSSLRIFNYQDIALRIDSIRLALNNPKYTITTQTSSFFINRGDSAIVNVRFAATDTVSTKSTGNHLDTILVYSNYTTSPLRLPLTAKVTSTILYSPAVTTVAFGTLTVSAYKDTALKVYNRTSAAYRIDSISFKSGKDYYLLSNTLTTQLKAGDSTLIQIRFSPRLAGYTVDTLFIWHNFAPLNITSPTKIVLTGTGSTNALISPSNYITVDNARGIEGYAISSPDSSYVETTINGFYQNLATYDYGGTTTGRRRTPNLSGSPNGSSARWTFRVDTTAPYLIYAYENLASNMGSNYNVQLRKFGINGIIDSMRYDERVHYTNYSPESGGSWLPLMMHRIEGIGPRAASITFVADNLSTTFMYCDAIRFLRSTQKADLEFGRRSLNFMPTRVPEEYGQITIGDEYVRSYRLYNIGRDTLRISNIQIYPTQTPVPWFYTKGYTAGSPLVVPPMTVGTDGKETGGFYDLSLAFGPYQEGLARDSMVISSNDDNEPKAYVILYGEGLNVNFILNASLGNTEPHYNAPGPPDVPVIPTYRETPNGSWLNSTASPIATPIPGTNSYSRVNTGGTSTFPHQCFYEFQLPEIYHGKVPTDGRYILEYGGPNYSSNAYSNTLVKVTHTFGVPPDSVNFDSRTDAPLLYPWWIQIGGTAKTFYLTPGGKISVEFRRDAQTDASGGIGYLRTDLFRVRKVPIGALIGVSVATGSTIAFGDVSFRTPGGVDGKANRKDITLASRGESQIIVSSIKFRNGANFRLLNPPSTPLYMRALVGEQALAMTFTPTRIAAGYVDTLEIRSNSTNRDSILVIPVNGNGIGGIYTVDDDGTTQEVASTPAFGGIFIGSWDKTKLTNWQVETSNVADSIGKGKTRRLLPIYFNGNARFEWFPQIPPDPATGDSVLMAVSVTLPRGFAKGSPGARYQIFSTGGNMTKDTVVNQNNPALTGGSNLVEVSLGNHYFLRNGRDVVNGQAFFGHVRLVNDTASASKYYGTTTNFARRDTFALVADAIILRELDRFAPSVTGVQEELPMQFALSQNYPNPFNPTTNIEFSLAKQVPVELKIYDLLGREVQVLLQNNAMNPGKYIVRWDGRNRYGQSVATGIYFYRLVAGDYVKTKKMMLIK